MGKQVSFRLDLNTVNGIPININSYNEREFKQTLYTLIKNRYNHQNIPSSNYMDFNILIDRYTHTLINHRNGVPTKIDYFNTYVVPTLNLASDLVFNLLWSISEIIFIIQTL